MFHAVQDFLDAWESETISTARVLEELTDSAMEYRPAERFRSLGELAWHIVTGIREIGGRTGLVLSGPTREAAVPFSADALVTTYRASAVELAHRVASDLSDASLESVDDVYGEEWAKGKTLFVLLCHEIHHRGQLTSLYRLAGLRVPAIYGPSRDEWAPGEPRHRPG